MVLTWLLSVFASRPARHPRDLARDIRAGWVRMALAVPEPGESQ